MRLRARLDALEGRHFETIALQEELLSQRHERDLDALRAARAEARKDQLVNKVGTLLPAVTSKFMGKEVQKDPAVGALVESLSQEQTQALARMLRPDQLTLLGVLMQRHGRGGSDGNKPGNGSGNGNGGSRAN
jgi:hypothetical protein